MNLKLNKEEKQPPLSEPFVYTEDQLMARLRFFIGICLALTLTGIVFVVLYSIIFVTQPLNAISPIDQKFFELIIPIATFLTGTLSGIMLASKDDKVAQMKALEAATARPAVSPAPISAPQSSQYNFQAPRPVMPPPPSMGPIGESLGAKGPLPPPPGVSVAPPPPPPVGSGRPPLPPGAVDTSNNV